MGSIFASSRAIEALAALEQRDDGMRLVEVASALAAPISSVQVALGVLVGDDLVSVGPSRPPVYRIAKGQEGDVATILDIGCRHLPGERLLAAALRASPAVEFAAQDAAGWLVVMRWDVEPSDEVRLARMVARLDVAVDCVSHDEVREQLLNDGSLRERARRGSVAVGSVARSFPDPFSHGSPGAPFLGRLHPTVNRPSRTALARIALRFGIEEMRVFGSAVHADFRPDSDIDVMIRRRRGVRRTLEDELELRRALEDLLGRDVDIVDASVVRNGLRAKANSEGVILHG